MGGMGGDCTTGRAGVRRRILNFALLPVLLQTAAPALGAADLPRDSDRWVEVATANFRLWSDAGERRTRGVAAEMEQLRSVLAQLIPGVSVTSPCPTYVYVFKDRFALRPYAPRFQGKPMEVAGYTLSRPWGNYVAIDGDPRTDALHSIRHEYVHRVLHDNYAHLPLWLDEGLAEFYGAFHRVDGEARIGDPITDHIRWLRENPLIPLPQLFAIDHRSKDYHEGVRQGVFYAESWALTHYLLLGNPERRPQLSRMFALMQGGATQQEAFAQAFAGDYDGLERELNVYIHRKVFSYAQLPLKLDAEIPAAVRPMAAPDVLYRLGDLLLNGGPEASAAAAEHFRAALAADPRHGLATAGLGQIEEAAGRRQEALADYEKAVTLAPNEPYVHYLLGRFLLERERALEPGRAARSGAAAEPAASEPAADSAAAELARATELAPDLADAWSLLGSALLTADPASERAAAALATAHRLLPARIDVTLNLALSNARRGKPREAEALIESARAAGASAAELDRARRSLLAAAHHGFVAAYNQAVDLANHGKADDAIARLRELLASNPDSADAAKAQTLLDDVAAHRAHHD